MKSPRALLFFLDRCLHAQRQQGVVYTLHLSQLFNQSTASKYPRTYLSRNRTLLAGALLPKPRTDGHTSPLQIIMHLLIRLERFEKFYRRMISFLLASLIIFLGVFLTCYSLLEPPLKDGQIGSKSRLIKH